METWRGVLLPLVLAVVLGNLGGCGGGGAGSSKGVGSGETDAGPGGGGGGDDDARGGGGRGPTFVKPEGWCSLTFAVDDTANRTYGAGQLRWNGSFRYFASGGTDPESGREMPPNSIVYSPAWQPTDGPFPVLYDDGPIAAGGHEAPDAVAGDHVFSVEVYFDAREGGQTFEYGVINEFDNWIWVGPNGEVQVEPGCTGVVAAPGLTIPPFGSYDLKITLDTAALDTSLVPLPVDKVYLKGTMNSWFPVQLLDDGTRGDEVAGDGVFTYVQHERLGPHDGLLAREQHAQFVFVFAFGEEQDGKTGMEYKTGGERLPDGYEVLSEVDPEAVSFRYASPAGVAAFSDYPAGDGRTLVAEPIHFELDSRGAEWNTTVVIGKESGGEPPPPPGGEVEIQFVDPGAGPVGGGTRVTLTGTGFGEGATVTFGGAPAASVLVEDATTLRCTTPPAPSGRPGKVDVTVTLPGGASATYPDGFEYVEAPAGPRIDAIEPARGSTEGGDEVTLTGANFLDPVEVFFGGAPGVVGVHDAFRIVVTTPPHPAGTVDVTVRASAQETTYFGGFTYDTPGVDWVALQWPREATVEENGSFRVYGRVYDPGTTDRPGQGAGVSAQAGFGPRGSDPGRGAEGWLWFDAIYNVDAGNDDEYLADVVVGPPGDFDFCFRFSNDGGSSWTYADLDEGSLDGYDPRKAGKLTVTADEPPPPPVRPITVDGSLADWDPALFVAVEDRPSDWSDANRLQRLGVVVAEGRLYLAIQGTVEAARANAIVGYVDTNLGDAEGVEDLTGGLRDNAGALDDAISGTLHNGVPGFRPDFAFGSQGMASTDGGAATDAAGWRSLANPADFAWLGVGHLAPAPLVASAGGGGAIETSIPLQTLYPRGLPAGGARLALAVRVTNATGVAYANQCLPPDEAFGNDDRVIRQVQVLDLAGAGQ